MAEYSIPNAPQPQQPDRSYTINAKYLGSQILNPRDFPAAGTAVNLAGVASRHYSVNPNLVASQIADEAKFIVKSRGLAALKTAVISDFTIGDFSMGENLRRLQSDGDSRFGLPIYDVIQFGGDTGDGSLRYDTNQYDAIGKRFIKKTVVAQPSKLTTALLKIDQTKNLVVTNVQGRDGPVYEYISRGAYQLNIKGVVVSPYADVAPTDAERALVDLFEAPEALRVTSNVLNEVFNIFNVVVSTYNFHSEEGTRNVIHFEVNCMDENPFEIQTQRI